MNFQSGHFYHIYNIGNNRQKLFYNRENYLYFLRKVRSELMSVCDILAYCLMPNHYHFLISVQEENEGFKALPRKIGTIQSSYTQAINRRFNRNGSLFQQKAKAKIVDEGTDQLFICFQYIHQNPYVADLVEKLEDWEFSSFRDFAGLREGTLVNKRLAGLYLDLPSDSKEFKALSYQVISDAKVKDLFP